VDRQKERHREDDACEGTHCYIHHVDEPDSEYMCLECFHAWPTGQDLLNDHNELTRTLNAAYGHMVVVPEETVPENVQSCPHCAHDF
jgi:hypothetical protein